MEEISHEGAGEEVQITQKSITIEEEATEDIITTIEAGEEQDEAIVVLEEVVSEATSSL